MTAPGHRYARRISGFTLLELVVVLALAVLLVAIVPPLLTAALPGVELKSASRRIAAGLRLAREEAIRKGHDVAFILDLEKHRYQVEGPFRSLPLPEDMDLKLIAADSEMQGEERGAIRFFPDGSATGGRIILAREGKGWQVGVQWLSGHVQLAPWEEQ